MKVCLHALIWLFAGAFSMVNGRCPMGSIQGLSQTDCYVVQSSPALWFRAEENCIAQGGHLASIHGSLVNSFLAHIASQPCASEYWLGGGWNTEVSNGWSWTDGTPFKYTAWAGGEPSSSSSPICLSANAQTTDWYARSCYDSKPYVCRVPARFSGQPTDPTPLPCTECQTPTTCPEAPTCPSVPSVITTACPRIPTTPSTIAATTATTKLPVTCPTDWTYSEVTKKCYQIKRGIQESNYTAIVELCRSLSAELPSLHSQQENEWLTEYLFVTNSGYWAYKLGLFRENADSPWQWADGSPVDYTNWATPPDNYGNECVDNAAIGTDGQWYNTKEFCVPYDSAVCQKDPQ